MVEEFEVVLNGLESGRLEEDSTMIGLQSLEARQIEFPAKDEKIEIARELKTHGLFLGQGYNWRKDTGTPYCARDLDNIAARQSTAINAISTLCKCFCQVAVRWLANC